MTIRSFFALLSILTSFATPTQANNDIQNCLDRGLAGVLSAQNIDRYVDELAMAQRVVGAPWRSQDTDARLHIAAVMLQTLTDRLEESAAEYRGSTAVSTNIQRHARQPNYYGISGYVITPSGMNYEFETNVYIDGDDCRFYTLVVERVFSLREWLPQQTAVRAVYRQYGIRN